MSHLFLSYSRADLLQARNFYRKLRARGFQIWFDEEALLPGQLWEVEIEKAIHSAALVLVLLSTRSIEKTGFAQKEIRTALSAMERMPGEKPYLVPLRLDECQIPRQLAHLHCGTLNSEDDFERLIKALFEYIGPPLETTGIPVSYRRFSLQFERESSLILPGHGVAGIRVGALPADVRSRLGEPDEISRFDDCWFMEYKKQGLSFRMEKDAVRTIFVYAEGADGYAAFGGRTPEGVSTSSTRREIERVFGRPSTAGGAGVINYWVVYASSGIGATYNTKDTADLDARVHNLNISLARD